MCTHGNIFPVVRVRIRSTYECDYRCHFLLLSSDNKDNTQEAHRCALTEGRLLNIGGPRASVIPQENILRSDFKEWRKYYKHAVACFAGIYTEPYDGLLRTMECAQGTISPGHHVKVNNEWVPIIRASAEVLVSIKLDIIVNFYQGRILTSSCNNSCILSKSLGFGHHEGLEVYICRLDRSGDALISQAAHRLPSKTMSVRLRCSECAVEELYNKKVGV